MLELLLDVLAWILGLSLGAVVGLFVVVFLMVIGWFLMLLGAAVVAGAAETDEALGMLDAIRKTVLERWA